MIYSFNSFYGKIHLDVTTTVYPATSQRSKTIDLEKFGGYFTELKISSPIYSYKDLRDMFPNSNAISELCRIWKRWNHNGEHYGSRLQQNIINEFCAATNQQPTFEIGERILTQHNFLIDRGYKYGSEFLIEHIPLDIANKVNEVITELQSNDYQ
jgi:hypothetical protein